MEMRENSSQTIWPPSLVIVCAPPPQSFGAQFIPLHNSSRLMGPGQCSSQESIPSLVALSLAFCVLLLPAPSGSAGLSGAPGLRLLFCSAAPHSPASPTAHATGADIRRVESIIVAAGSARSPVSVIMSASRSAPGRRGARFAPEERRSGPGVPDDVEGGGTFRTGNCAHLSQKTVNVLKR